MAKYEKHLTGNFDELLELVTDGVLNGSMSASYEDGSDWTNGTVRCAVRVFERYSYMGGNRVSMNVTLVGNDRDLFFLRHHFRWQFGRVLQAQYPRRGELSGKAGADRGKL